VEDAIAASSIRIPRLIAALRGPRGTVPEFREGLPKKGDPQWGGRVYKKQHSWPKVRPLARPSSAS